MMTFDEMVKYLREKAGAFDYQGWTETAIDYELAADAIEKLNKEVMTLRSNYWDVTCDPEYRDSHFQKNEWGDW